MISPVMTELDPDGDVLVGPQTADDAGVYRFAGTALVATADFITPVCDEALRFGRVAAANSISDIYAMGGKPLFALNLCCFPKEVPDSELGAILEGGSLALADAGAVLLGGHSVQDKDLKYGLAVIGQADPDRLMTNSGARVGDRLILTKPLGTGATINAFRKGKLAQQDLEPALLEMERLNSAACELASSQGVRGATDITGFGLVGHALNLARASGVGLQLEFAGIPAHESFYRAVAAGVSTGSTAPNLNNAREIFEDRASLKPAELELLFDPQTSGGLLLSIAADRSAALLDELSRSAHQAADIGEVIEPPVHITIV